MGNGDARDDGSYGYVVAVSQQVGENGFYVRVSPVGLFKQPVFKCHERALETVRRSSSSAISAPETTVCVLVMPRTVRQLDSCRGGWLNVFVPILRVRICFARSVSQPNNKIDASAWVMPEHSKIRSVVSACWIIIH